MFCLAAVSLILVDLCVLNALPIENSCVTYPDYNLVDWADGKDRLCTSKNNITYCKEWDCPTPSCDNPISGEYGICSSYCPGTCTYGGTEHKIGESFISPDGSNTCWCGEYNTYFCTYSGFTVKTLCNSGWVHIPITV